MQLPISSCDGGHSGGTYKVSMFIRLQKQLPLRFLGSAVLLGEACMKLLSRLSTITGLFAKG